MKQKAQSGVLLLLPPVLGRQLVGALNIVGRPVNKKGGFSVDINFTMQSNLHRKEGSVVADRTNDKP